LIACLIQALEHTQSKSVLHRDIKPENLVIDHKGYLKLTDFGIARVLRENNGSDTSGTPGYMAPEVLFHVNHSFEVDFFAVGVITYELMFGKRPLKGYTRDEIREEISSN